MRRVNFGAVVPVLLLAVFLVIGVAQSGASGPGAVLGVVVAVAIFVALYLAQRYIGGGPRI